MQLIWLHFPPSPPVLGDQNPSGGRPGDVLTLKFEKNWIQAIILLAVTIFNFKPFVAYDF